MLKIYHGTFIDTPSPKNFRVQKNTFALVEDGKLKALFSQLPPQFQNHPILDFPEGVIIPAFTDLHVHAPQHMQMGAGLDLGLLDWLNQFTFPGESRFGQREYAQELYPIFAQELLRQGSLRSVVYGTVHRESTAILAKEMERLGLKAMVGKVNMDQNSPDSLRENLEQSLEDTLGFTEDLQDYRNIKAILTPRFAPSCSQKLMTDLSAIAKEKELPIQSHLGETRKEIQWVSQLFPNSTSYTGVYHDCGLLGPNTLMAHGIYLTAEEIDLITQNQSTLVHCPMANTNLSSGVMSVGSLWDKGVRIGLGTDVGAGHSLSMTKAMTQAVQASKLLTTLVPEEGHRVLALSEAFYLATKGNGRFFHAQGMGACGAFEEGMSFDALQIHMDLPPMAQIKPLNELERFLYAGDDRNIKQRILAGEKLL